MKETRTTETNTNGEKKMMTIDTDTFNPLEILLGSDYDAAAPIISDIATDETCPVFFVAPSTFGKSSWSVIMGTAAISEHPSEASARRAMKAIIPLEPWKI